MTKSARCKCNNLPNILSSVRWCLSCSVPFQTMCIWTRRARFEGLSPIIDKSLIVFPCAGPVITKYLCLRPTLFLPSLQSFQDVCGAADFEGYDIRFVWI